MNKTTALIAAIALSAAVAAYALFTVSNTGDWPASWPKELEPLRKQARTLVGPKVEYRAFAITFTKREDLEAAWPHILQVKNAGAPVTLTRAPNFFLGDGVKAGVVIHCPPAEKAYPAEEPGKGKDRATSATSIELVVDGEVVDLNRIPLPPDTPIHDRRFKEAKDK